MPDGRIRRPTTRAHGPDETDEALLLERLIGQQRRWT